MNMQDDSFRWRRWFARSASADMERPRRLALVAALMAFVVSGSVVLFPPLLMRSPAFGGETSGTPAPLIVGSLTFRNSGQLDTLSRTGLNDIVTLDLHGLLAPPAGESYEAWLLPDRAAHGATPLWLGTLQVTKGKARLVYRAPTHRDLLASYSGVCVLARSTGDLRVPDAAALSAGRYGGRFADVPRPGDEQRYSLLDHLRHLVARDPDLVEIGLDGGLAVWLVRNGGKVWEWASAARDEWGTGATDLLHRQIIRILEYLDGAAFAARDLPTGTPWLVDQQAGHLGLLPVEPDQAPPAYLTHIATHLEGLKGSPGHTQAQVRLASQVEAALAQVERALSQVHQDARRLVRMTDAQLKAPQALALLDDLALHASLAYVGQFRPPEGNVDGIVWIGSVLQQLAVLPIEATARVCL
jgi:hypothetical protein